MFAKPNASVRLHEPSSDPKPFRPNLLISEAPTMSKEELTSLIQRVATNTSLRDQLASASDLQTVATISQDNGLRINLDELATAPMQELTQSELEGADAGQFGSYCQCHQTICKNYTIDM